MSKIHEAERRLLLDVVKDPGRAKVVLQSMEILVSTCMASYSMGILRGSGDEKDVRRFFELFEEELIGNAKAIIAELCEHLKIQDPFSVNPNQEVADEIAQEILDEHS